MNLHEYLPHEYLYALFLTNYYDLYLWDSMITNMVSEPPSSSVGPPAIKYSPAIESYLSFLLRALNISSKIKNSGQIEIQFQTCVKTGHHQA